MNTKAWTIFGAIVYYFGMIMILWVSARGIVIWCLGYTDTPLWLWILCVAAGSLMMVWWMILPKENRDQ